MDNDNKFISCKQREQIARYNNEILTASKYVVQNMKPAYKELEGTYDSVIDIKRKICQLQYKDMLIGDLEWVINDDFYDDGYFKGNFKCPKCAKEDNPVAFECCQNRKCYYSNESIWRNVEFDLNSPKEIYTCKGGSLSICHPIGKIVSQ